MTNAELFEKFFQDYVKDKFPGIDHSHPNVKRVEELLRAGFRGACAVKDEEIKFQKIEMSNMEVSYHNLQTKLEETSRAGEKRAAKLIKGLRFYAEQKGHALFEIDGSKKRTLGERAAQVLADDGSDEE